jgi:hypothetical protein
VRESHGGKKNEMKKILAAGATLAAASLLALAPVGHASPGQCGQGYAGGNGGGFCDGPPRADGSWYHCETVYVLGFGGTNCFWVRPVPLDVDARGWVPA